MNTLETIQSDLDEVVTLIKADLTDEGLKKLRPDLYAQLIHAVKEKEILSRSSLNQSQNDFLYLSLERFR